LFSSEYFSKLFSSIFLHEIKLKNRIIKIMFLVIADFYNYHQRSRATAGLGLN
jgi:hypothetical protein